MPRVFAYIAHKSGVPEEGAWELAAAARKLDPAALPVAVLTGWGQELEDACQAVRAGFVEIWKIAHERLSYPDAELVRQALATLVPSGGIVLAAHNHFGVDLAPGLSVKMNAAYVPDVLDMQPAQGAGLTLVRQEFGGQVSAHVHCDVSAGAVITVRPGAFRPLESVPKGGTVVDKSSEIGPLAARRRYVRTIVPEAGDVDITKEKILVSIGRGIGEKDNVELAEELAAKLGGAVSCSRPVVDAKWLDKSRQVGSSGQTVRPKVYMACGISGSFQHLAGLKGSPFLIAINKNPKAPIFRVADIGVVDDILEFLPAMTEQLHEKAKAAGGRP